MKRYMSKLSLSPNGKVVGQSANLPCLPRHLHLLLRVSILLKLGNCRRRAFFQLTQTLPRTPDTTTTTTSSSATFVVVAFGRGNITKTLPTITTHTHCTRHPSSSTSPLGEAGGWKTRSAPCCAIEEGGPHQRHTGFRIPSYTNSKSRRIRFTIHNRTHAEYIHNSTDTIMFTSTDTVRPLPPPFLTAGL